MAKYETLVREVYKYFADLTGSIPSYPSEITPQENHEKFIKISVIPGGDGINLNSVSGIIIIDIYTSAEGFMEAYSIADTLDDQLVGKLTQTEIGGSLQFPIASSMVPKGNDKHNNALVRFSYTIPFKYFGVQ